MEPWQIETRTKACDPWWLIFDPYPGDVHWMDTFAKIAAPIDAEVRCWHQESGHLLQPEVGGGRRIHGRHLCVGRLSLPL